MQGNMCMAICAWQYVHGNIPTTPAGHHNYKTTHNWKAFKIKISKQVFGI